MQINQVSQFSFFAMLIAILVILMSAASLRISDFKEYHHSLAENTVTNVSESISQFILNRKRLIKIFAKENTPLIQKLILDPENDELKLKLDTKIKEYFPSFFSYTLSDLEGNPYYDDFEGYVGDLCVADIKIYSKNKKNFPRIHPNSFSYHYDLMADFPIGQEEYIIFISFTADEIGELLKNSEAPGHKTVLVFKENSNLLEITADGARNKHFRADYRLTEKELSYLLFEKPVNGSKWTAYNFYEDELFSEHKKKTYLTALTIFLIFTFVSTILYSIIKKEKIKREKAESVKNDFVTVVSHELRTPLTSINGAIKLIENEALGPINDNIKSYLNMASGNIDRLTNIINDILDVKKMESGEFHLIKENINLVDLVEKAVNENIDYAKQFNAEFNFINPDASFIVNADSDRLMQVLSNLLSNAVKYGATNDCINISFKKLTKHIRLNIEDHGSGLPEKHKEQIFEKFTQAHSRDTEIVKGTGLGLNIVKKIVEAHDGTVSYDAGKDKGTVFYIILPLV